MGKCGGHILQAVYGQVNLPGEQGCLEVLDEDPLSPRHQRTGGAVASGRNLSDRKSQVGPRTAQASRHPLRLYAGQPTAARAQEE